MDKKTLTKIRAYFAKIKAVRLVYLYGSQAKGEAKKDSDIDLAILVKEDKAKQALSSDIQLQAIADLPRLVGKEVEVQNLNICKTTFAYRVISKGKAVFQRDNQAQAEFEEQVMRNYFDLKPILDEYSYYFAQRVRKGLIAKPFYQIKR